MNVCEQAHREGAMRGECSKARSGLRGSLDDSVHDDSCMQAKVLARQFRDYKGQIP